MRGRRRRVAWVLAALVVIAALAATTRLPVLTGWTIERVARARGLPLDLDVLRVGWRGLDAAITELA